eukprot:6922292-Pyramimonas_sp.AAC.1
MLTNSLIQYLEGGPPEVGCEGVHPGGPVLLVTGDDVCDAGGDYGARDGALRQPGGAAGRGSGLQR